MSASASIYTPYANLSRRLLIHSVRVAARMADSEPEKNPVFVQALQLMADALEEAGISSRVDGDYWLVKIPSTPAKQQGGKRWNLRESY